MIVIHATGFIGDKPQLQYIGSATNRKAKVEFEVVSRRRAMVEGAWTDLWERVTFVAWDDEAVRCAELFDQHSHVTCYGEQETSCWIPQGETRKVYRTRYRLTAWAFTAPRRVPAASQAG